MSGPVVPFFFPKDNTGIGFHAAADPWNPRWRGAAGKNVQRDREFDLIWRMGGRWLKFYAAGDTMGEAVQEATRFGFVSIVRHQHKPPTLDVVPSDQIEYYVDRGAIYQECFLNEPELELGRPPLPEVIDAMTEMYRRFADACYTTGAIPITPAIQGDRFEKWFKPFIDRMIAKGWKDALEGSVIGGHWRPGAMPPDSPPIDQAQGGVGFVFRSYEHWHDYLISKGLGEQPMFGTEAGYEPTDLRPAPEKDPDWRLALATHAQWNMAIAQMAWRPILWCQCFWLLLPHPHWPESCWFLNKRGKDIASVAGCLPVVEKFIEMPKIDRTVPIVPPPPPVDDLGALAAKEVARVVGFQPFLLRYAWRQGYEALGSDAVFQSGGKSYIARLLRKGDRLFVAYHPAIGASDAAVTVIAAPQILLDSLSKTEV